MVDRTKIANEAWEALFRCARAPAVVAHPTMTIMAQALKAMKAALP